MNWKDKRAKRLTAILSLILLAAGKIWADGPETGFEDQVREAAEKIRSGFKLQNIEGQPFNEHGWPVADAREHEEMVRAWAKAMMELESAREHLDFLAKNEAAVWIVEPRINQRRSIVPPESNAVFEGSAVYFNRKTIEETRRSLQDAGVSGEELSHLVALKTLPAFCGALRAMMGWKELKDKSGIDFSVATVETEILGYMDQSLVVQEIRIRYPALKDYRVPIVDTIDSLVTLGGSEGIERLVRRDSLNFPSLRDWSSRHFLAHLKNLRAGSEENLEAIRRYKKQDDEDSRAIVRYAPAEEYMDSQIRRIKAAEAVADDKGDYAKLKEFYESKIRELSDRLSQPRTGGSGQGLSLEQSAKRVRESTEKKDQTGSVVAMLGFLKAYERLGPEARKAREAEALELARPVVPIVVANVANSPYDNPEEAHRNASYVLLAKIARIPGAIDLIANENNQPAVSRCLRYLFDRAILELMIGESDVAEDLVQKAQALAGKLGLDSKAQVEAYKMVKASLARK